MPSLGPADREELLIHNPREWSAVTVTLPTGTLVVTNPTHDEARTNNSICHELSHLILKHRHGRMITFGDCVMREFDNQQEGEADWLAGSLLAPEAALKQAKFARMDHAQTARHLGASEELVRWRWNASGIDRYLSGPRRAGALRPQ
ncbi:ImmA/IrrE family metallo-endopeptidase [Micromonospora sp. WMMD1102]|uniref:ImmA/IrrE family metallo-endopeptidase n=1 Tax=Micromonospora sp. WMMD1102 TaxID=3016105 RepID=UPI003242B1A2